MELVGGRRYTSGCSSGHRAGQNNIIHRLVFNNGVPFQLTTKNSPVKPANEGQYFGVYGQDSWTIARRVTLNLGLRVEHDTAWRPEQCRVAAEFAPARCWDRVDLRSFTSLAPRLALAYDVSGDGKTVIKGGYGRFNQLREILPDVTGLNENLRSQTTWDWHDNNGNRQYDAGEVNLDPNGPDFRSISGTALGVVNPNEKQPKTDEFSLTFERELIANTAVRVTGVYSRNTNVFAKSELSRDGQYTIPDHEYRSGTRWQARHGDDPGTSITYYEYPSALGGAAFATDDASQQRCPRAGLQDVRSRLHQAAVQQLAAQRVVLGHVDECPGHLRQPEHGHRARHGHSGSSAITNRCLQDPNTTFNSANDTLRGRGQDLGRV